MTEFSALSTASAAVATSVHGDDEPETFEDWVEDDDAEQIQSLFSVTILPSVEEMLNHDLESFGFDLREIVGSSCQEYQDVILLINFIRSTVAAMEDKGGNVDVMFVQSLVARIQEGEFKDESMYMTPVKEDDALLYLLQDALINLDPVRFGFLVDEMETDGDLTAGVEAVRQELVSSAAASSIDEETIRACKEDVIVTATDKV